jgi:hypothetical protein
MAEEMIDLKLSVTIPNVSRDPATGFDIFDTLFLYTSLT